MNLPTTRRSALKSGESYYLTNTPCKYGHMSKRHISNGNCTECFNTIHKKARKKHDKKSSLIWGKKRVRRNAESKIGASNYYQKWTLHDISLVTKKGTNDRYVHTAKYYSERLKRTQSGIERARDRYVEGI